MKPVVSRQSTVTMYLGVLMDESNSFKCFSCENFSVVKERALFSLVVESEVI